MITKYGYDVYWTIAAGCLVLVVLSFLFIEPRAARYGVSAVAILALAFATNFFRDPDRSTPADDSAVISPADGKVILIREARSAEFMQGDAIQVSIFMSPLDVHVNRNPVSGVVRYMRYVKGEYFAAFEDKASEKNEQMIVGIENGRGKVLMKQIAGFVARRIVCSLALNERVVAGERFGMIKFGSRVDVLLPNNSHVRVHVGDRTVAGETVLATLGPSFDPRGVKPGSIPSHP